MDKVSMLHLTSFSRYQTKCVIKFFFKQLITSQTFRFFLNQPLKQWLTGKKKGEDEYTKSEYLENKKSYLDELFEGLSFGEK